MKTINKFLLEKLIINKNSELNEHIYTLPVCREGVIENDQVWRSFKFPEKQFIIYKDKYRHDGAHFADFEDFICSMMYGQEDYEDFNIENDILYASDNLKDALEWYFKNIFKIEPPTEDTGLDWIDDIHRTINPKLYCDSPEILYDIYMGEDKSYNNVHVSFTNPDNIVKNVVKLIGY